MAIYMTKVFVDGSHGTTGLRIVERLSKLKEYTVDILPYEHSKDINKRIEAIDNADVAILCLPDDSAREIVSKITNTKIIDTSTAHRVAPGFTYGFAEIGFREDIKNAEKIAVPGCHVTGFLSLVVPLVDNGIVKSREILTCHSITGYSGGGKDMIAKYTSPERGFSYKLPRQYGLGLGHKHLNEMKFYSGLTEAPLFSPILADVYSGMAVTVPYRITDSKYTGEDIANILKDYYKDEQLIKVYDFNSHPAIEEGALNPAYKKDKDSVDIIVTGHGKDIMLISLFDNLGKGASGTALQCLNLVTGNKETLGLDL